MAFVSHMKRSALSTISRSDYRSSLWFSVCESQNKRYLVVRYIFSKRDASASQLRANILANRLRVSPRSVITKMRDVVTRHRNVHPYRAKFLRSDESSAAALINSRSLIERFGHTASCRSHDRSSRLRTRSSVSPIGRARARRTGHSAFRFPLVSPAYSSINLINS